MLGMGELMLNDPVRRGNNRRNLSIFILQRSVSHGYLPDGPASRALPSLMVEARSGVVIQERLSGRRYTATSEIATRRRRSLEMTPLEAVHQGADRSK